MHLNGAAFALTRSLRAMRQSRGWSVGRFVTVRPSIRLRHDERGVFVAPRP